MPPTSKSPTPSSSCKYPGGPGAEPPAVAGRHEPALEWREGGVPVATRFDDPYFSLADGLAETRHVFLTGNDLPARLVPGFHVAELGFGTGLNCLALAAITEMPVRMTSFEAFPMSLPQLEQAHAAFPELADLAAELRAGWDREVIAVGQVELRLIKGNVRETLPQWQGRADAWFLDGFSPAKNPEMWSDELLAEVRRHTAPGGSFATYTAAGHVRRALEAAGFSVERRPGFGRKRHMSTGRMPL
ncbi:tRNA (5-methylaminomethyl-2-thiouridine)(34)-methyltransferase MnmD [Paracoccus saliphilus]|uniref:tRNA (5-methylaminomethyl-2-thiouridine)(34)-methyltransferase MnmD n=1 Tax=Paracoccus saliphilus TaxID=405559 RepID=A0ABY7S9E7_9RHOB|nr:tRNA (5-methylaminomethyl-2-thiouridine)(34)-methyltransferase MnmD [Paracoccus saliphilus]WCR03454.1 tRNA (5-methylaminomethyl-2-thiouridine)(34)-methyltransferase MnmD [Paracoccus saliphilus]